MTDITLLDGSIGQEIVKRSGDRATHLWSTAVMMEKPDVVGDVHADYYRVGATIATTNTYAVHRDRLIKVGLEDKVPELVDTALVQAARARAAHGRGRIAGALGPLGGSYRPDISPSVEVAAPVFAELVEIMGARVDLILIETVSSVMQARATLTGCADATVPVWLGVSVDDDDGTILRSGERLSELAPVLAEFKPDAVLINCSRPEAVSMGVPHIAALGLPFGAYANGFTRISEGFLQDSPTVDALEQRVDLGPDAYADFAMGWVEGGATIVGGCCEVGPEHIAELARRLRAAGHTIV
ncbi:homocysteine S-methyltransferase family protein [Roseovarius sp. LXJ103]|uniref:homocysteine S-methyltransferase family protein n=1 Tax=Roseovarius carneus TaxID=2853164 RepID=UPI000D60F8F2|nr:homocysteine S-methyltransferase family protein [Roseovarius carneus]MBZ8118490.1 homocysteine S-methyltransferase family protein [Roseovarius carneus]PWE35812.1 homocysteine S-methyltransferase [Pelagicola sp. LXJ1103]